MDEAKLQKKQARKEKEIARLLKEKNKPKFAGYMFLFLFIVTLVYLVDEVSTNIGKFMELDVAASIFGSVAEYNSSSVKELVNTLIMAISGSCMLLRPLADRFGRKIFLFIYTLGMAIGMGAIAVFHNIPGWVVGTLLIQICIPHDMQQVYIQECAPREKRGTYFSVIKGLATLGLMLVPIFRTVFDVEVNKDNWILVYGGTAAVGLIAVILAVIFMRESDAFVENRLKQLALTDEELARLKKEKSEEAKRGGIIQGLVAVFKHKQLRWITISMCFCMLAYVLTDHYSTIIGLGYLNAHGLALSATNYQLPEISKIVTDALFFYPIGCALVEFLPGVISDKIGRKKASIFFGAGALVFYVLFYFASLKLWDARLTGFFIGAACGSVWSFGDLLLLMISESTATNLRVSTNTSCLLVAGICYAIAGAVINAISAGLGSDNYLGPCIIVTVAVGLTAALITTLLKVKETVGVDLNTITSSEYEK